MRLPVALEIGKRRTFAMALDWPGWCRAGRGEEAALAAFVAYGTRYAAAMTAAGIAFAPVEGPAELEIVERLPGSASTDFGAPGSPPSADARSITRADLDRLESILIACWRAFDEAADAAAGQELATGPRGGGRQLVAIREHLAEAEAAYVRRLGGMVVAGWSDVEIRRGFADALEARARGELADVGLRGGKRWSPRFAVRRSAWHALDHAWEIDDRVAPG